MELHLRELTPSGEQLVAAMCLDERQQEFSGGDVLELFASLRNSPYPEAVHPFIVAHDDTAIGLFVLREAPALPTWALPDVMTLHNFRIGKEFQRQGYGTATVRTAAQWVAENCPTVSLLMLSVNVENEPAASLYQSCGFRSTGAAFDGRVGRERIMLGTIAAILTKCRT